MTATLDARVESLEAEQDTLRDIVGGLAQVVDDLLSAQRARTPEDSHRDFMERLKARRQT